MWRLTPPDRGLIAARIATRFGAVRTDRPTLFYAKWRVPARARLGRYAFCVVAGDGKLSSRPSCAFLRVRR